MFVLQIIQKDSFATSTLWSELVKPNKGKSTLPVPPPTYTFFLAQEKGNRI